MVSTKRGAHLALSLERLERIAPTAAAYWPVGDSAAASIEVARYLGGAAKAATKNRRTRSQRQKKSRTSKPQDLKTILKSRYTMNSQTITGPNFAP